MATFIDALEPGGAEFAQTMALLTQTAHTGPPRNLKKCRRLSADVYEFKTRTGVRIPFFYDTGRVIICSEALHKPKRTELRRVIARAERARHAYFEAKRRSDLHIDETTP